MALNFKIMKQLRFSTTNPMFMLGMFNDNEEDHKLLATPKDKGVLIISTLKGEGAYIHGDAEEIAGYDIPSFIDGNLGQLDLPISEQDILMLLPSGEYKCKAELCQEIGAKNRYLITLK
jgi:hypothetical protein